MSSEIPQEPDHDVLDGEVMHESSADPATPPTSPTPPAPSAAGQTPPVPDPDYSTSGVPTFDFVRDKIENRISTAIGSEELAENGPKGRRADEMLRKRDEAAKKKLDEIRKSMGR